MAEIVGERTDAAVAGRSAVARGHASGKAAAVEELRVFISYSRADIAAADSLVETLEQNGIVAVIDRRNLPYGEEWLKELGGLIAGSDAVIWLVSPDSVKSRWCNWELGEVGRLSKRLVPVKLRDIDADELPEALGRINLLPSEGAYDPGRHQSILVETLKTDRAWLKRATRLAEDAREWVGSGRDGARLLRGTELGEAEEWSSRVPREMPAPASEIREFILASAGAQRRRQRYLMGALVAAAVLLVAVAAVLFVLQQRAQVAAGIAEQQRAVAVEQERIATERRNLALRNESVSLAALSTVAGSRKRAVEAAKLAVAAWPRRSDPDRPMLRTVVPSVAGALSNLFRHRELAGHEVQFTEARFSPDGRLVVTAAWDGTARLWEAATGRSLHVLRHPPAFAGDLVVVTAAAFSPDSRRVASSVLVGHTLVWEAATGRRLCDLDVPSGAGLAFSPDGARLLVGSRDGSASIWRLSDCARLHRYGPFAGREQPLSTVRFSADGSAFLIASEGDGRIRVFDASDNRQVAEFTVAGLGAVDISSDGGHVAATSSQDRTVTVWNVRSGAAQSIGHGVAGVAAAAFSPAGPLLVLATASADRTVRLWSVWTDSHQLLREFAGFSQTPDLLRFSADGSALLAASAGAEVHEVRVWSAEGPLLAEMDEPVRSIFLADLSQDGRSVLTTRGGYEEAEPVATIWAISDLAPLARLEVEGVPSALAFSPDGRLLAADAAGDVRLWTADGGEGAGRIAVGASRIEALQFSPQGDRVVIGDRDGRAEVRDIGSGRLVAAFRHGDRVNSAVFSPDGLWVLTASDDGMSALWDAASGRLEVSRQGPAVKSSDEVWEPKWSAFSPDGQRAATVYASGLVEIWSTADASTLLGFEVDRLGLYSVAFSPQGDVVLTAGQNGGRLWEAATGRPVSSFDGKGSAIESAAFSADGSRVLTRSRMNGVVKVWDVASGALLATVNAPSAFAAAISPDAGRIAVGMTDVDLWDTSAIAGQDAVALICRRLGDDVDLQLIRERYAFAELAPICGADAPLPLDVSKLQ